MKKTLFFAAFLTFFNTEIVAQQRGVYLDEKTNRFGLANPETGEPTTAPMFETAFHVEGTDSLVIAKTATGFGLFAASGREIVPPVFDDLYFDRLGAGAMGFIAALKDNSKGLFAIEDGKKMLPVEFEVVGAVAPNLVFGRRAGAKTLEFFDERGRKTCNIEGQMAYTSTSAGDFNVLKNDGSLARFEEGGHDFSSGAQRVSTRAWIFQSLTKNGEPANAALLNEAGDTLVKDAFEIRKVGVVRFVVGLKNKPFSRFGLCDDMGKWLIQPSEKTIRTIGRPLAFNDVLVLSDGKGNEQIWSKNGQLLLDSCRVGPFNIDKELVSRVKQSAEKWFFTASRKGENGTLGLFRLNGRQVLPMAFSHIRGASEKHPVVASRRLPLGGFSVNAYDLETGRKLFEEDFENLLFTTDPQVFWAKKNDAWALVNYLTYNRLRPKFEIATVSRLPSLCFEIYEKGNRKVVDPTGATKLAANLEYIASTKRRQFEQFFERTGRRGQLVAVETRRSDPEGAWRAIGMGGERYFFESEMAKTESLESVSMEAIQEATEVVVIPEPPSPAHEVSGSLDSKEVMNFVETPPQFPGGAAALLKFLSENLKYPPLAKENGIEGRVILNFIVEKDGSLSDVRIVRDIGGGCGKEAVRLVQAMPKYLPGKQNGQAVRVKYTLPVAFKLN
jgi:TonB family protein